MSYFTRESSFILIQFFLLNLDGSSGALPPNFFFFFDITLSYYYINLRSSIIFFSSSIKSNIFCFISNFFWTVPWQSSLYFHNFMSNVIANQITSCSCYFFSHFFELVLRASVADYLVWSRSLCQYSPLKSLPIYLLILLAKE